ncbi:DNA-binding protein [Fibrobacter succinogenes subsp. succinogenes S85]|jgi:transcriptional regulator with XRE-family HTH domain|uniref:DNA-binding protein n=1 Tax=Fibrobacter succinogenes (strain ATCC 19169 / S85) TaxID=59374 RepID=C9RKL9_FIBSS|nr:helix-turn-helix transcriptional regulator [Fibrobacter succinogenes]ACX73947.1 transcriptional regulator, XRE family [Fibrobacter succinogenes subsp. succinogenes S85]ADL27245.1 DNA-binding protein [Fibrobacter succinogenes subsp. succinogenes S85]
MNYETLLLHEAIRLLIISIRQQRRHTQQSLSLESGISRQYISQMECGKRIPSLDTLSQLAIALKTSMGSLMSEMDRIYQHLFWQSKTDQVDKNDDFSARNAAETHNPSLEYIHRAGGLDKP